ncbi:MAG: hypothetical protein K9N09_03045 [Candidatus Cloacimonetes bacterium]|nr:hypothetical protein [Candidatus Cloacimonadota bacterium]MCF7814818.1 hypothetical protein [Candidatus Cloacimonadota bacterium]MCF7867652.1 hypothetical protein [Candidatus Cloacimonadota bacterium]MCF7883550.1 hypothetical protein [Candidatus Cloacimonadota bacterium]
MRGFYWYLITFVTIMLFFRFFGFIMAYAIRFWFVVIPVVLILYYYFRKQKADNTFKRNTGLDPDKEVKLKEEPKVEEEE